MSNAARRESAMAQKTKGNLSGSEQVKEQGT
jgi:hypothetical protein